MFRSAGRGPAPHRSAWRSALVVAALLVGVAAAPAGPVAAAEPLTNLAHLDFLGDEVTPPAQ